MKNFWKDKTFWLVFLGFLYCPITLLISSSLRGYAMQEIAKFGFAGLIIGVPFICAVGTFYICRKYYLLAPKNKPAAFNALYGWGMRVAYRGAFIIGLLFLVGLSFVDLSGSQNPLTLATPFMVGFMIFIAGVVVTIIIAAIADVAISLKSEGNNAVWNKWFARILLWSYFIIVTLAFLGRISKSHY